MSIVERVFGTTEHGKPIRIFSIKNQNNLVVEITEYGGRIVSILAPDRWNHLDDIVLGFPTAQQYLAQNPYLGAIMGRCSNRIANAEIKMNGKTFYLSKNHNQRHHIHGGYRGFDKVIWQAAIPLDNESSQLRLHYFSLDGEEGYPGNLEVEVTYALRADNSLQIDYLATTDQDTLVNLTNHTYFNLLGEGKGDVLNHRLKLDSGEIVEVDSDMIPTGKLLPVAGTRFDFQQFEAVGARSYIDKDGSEKMGYDQNWVLNGTPGLLEQKASLIEPITGRRIDVSTTLPGMQVYTANSINKWEGFIGKGGNRYYPYSGICLETQYFPDAIHHNHFPSPILRKGDTYHHTTIYHFSAH